MDVIEKFGNRVSSQALKDPEKARRLLLAGYRLQEKKLQFLPDRGLPSPAGAGWEQRETVAAGNSGEPPRERAKALSY